MLQWTFVIILSCIRHLAAGQIVLGACSYLSKFGKSEVPLLGYHHDARPKSNVILFHAVSVIDTFSEMLSLSLLLTYVSVSSISFVRL